MRAGLRALLETQKDFVIAGEVNLGQLAVTETERLKPDLLALSLQIPGLNGFTVCSKVRKRSPNTRVLLISRYADGSYLADALNSGARGYVLEDCSAMDLFKAVREVVAGRRFLCPSLPQSTLQLAETISQFGTRDPYESLTRREREVLRLAAEGYKSRQIGVRLAISPRTAETHRANLMRKLKVRNQTELVRVALRRGVVRLGESSGRKLA